MTKEERALKAYQFEQQQHELDKFKEEFKKNYGKLSFRDKLLMFNLVEWMLENPEVENKEN